MYSVVMMIWFLKLGVSKCSKGKEKSDSLVNKFQINRTKDTGHVIRRNDIIQ